MSASRRQSNLADIQSDQESLSSSSETLLTANNDKTNVHCRVRTSKVTAGPRRTMSMKETNGKPVMKGNMKIGKAMSATERPGGVGEGDKKVEDKVKTSGMVKDGQRIQQRTSISSPKEQRKTSQDTKKIGKCP